MSLGFEGFGSNLEVHEQFDRDGLSSGSGSASYCLRIASDISATIGS